MTIISLTPIDLMIAASLVLLLAVLSVVMHLGIAKRLIIAAIRTTVQLLLVGFILNLLFDNIDFFWITLAAFFMLLVAGREVYIRQKRPLAGFWGYGIGTITMFVSSFSITIFTLLVIVSPTPWYAPQYSIPLLGMLLGNTMTAVSLTLDRLTQYAWESRDIIEQRLMLGETSSEVFSDYKNECIRMGLTPIINAMVASGIIHLPGMMTGQLIAGNTPVEAAKYQILIMFIIASCTGFGAIGAVSITSKRLFDERHRLRLDRLRS